MSLFLSTEQLAEFTGIKRGKGGQTREQLQIAWLVETGIPHIVNARGCPKVTTETINCRKSNMAIINDDWTPSVLSAA